MSILQFLGDKQTINTSIVLAMQRQEIKTLAVAFSPYCVGPVAGKITIKHYTRESSDFQQSKKVPIFNAAKYFNLFFNVGKGIFAI